MRIFKRVVLGVVTLAVLTVGFAWWYDRTGQKSDPNFDVHVATPAYPGTGP
jgi:hypothetical protein